jgi:hypothetical protein
MTKNFSHSLDLSHLHRAKYELLPLSANDNCNVVFGSRLKFDAEGVGALISSWSHHQPSILPTSDKDFKRLNILSIGKGACTAPKQRSFRRSVDLRLKSATSSARSIVPDMTFGLSAKPSTPIKAVISHFYADHGDATPASRTSRKQSARIRVPLFASEKPEEPKKTRLFKLKRFLSIAARTSSRRK